MGQFDVSIVNLEQLQGVSLTGFGSEPEGIAWNKVIVFLKNHELWSSMAELGYYGFNSPDPSPGSPNYGYQQWVVLPEGIKTDEVNSFSFPGGLYAVTRCYGIQNLPERWRDLAGWVEKGSYQLAKHQCLEQWINPDPGIEFMDEVFLASMEMDLFIPIAK